MSVKIAFLGLGVMGFPMAGHLSKNNYDLNIYNRSVSKSENWIKNYQGNLCKTPAEAIENADYIITCVGEDKDLLEIFEGSNGILEKIKSGSIKVSFSSGSIIWFFSSKDNEREMQSLWWNRACKYVQP